MNKWECEEKGCTSVAIGTGGAPGLRAIGWWFKPGSGTKCPAHRPDAGVKKHPEFPCDVKGPCSMCTADQEADRIQYLIVNFLKWQGWTQDYHRKNAERWDA